MTGACADDAAAARLGAHPLGGGRCAFKVWAPERTAVSVRLESPESRLLPMAKDGDGYWGATADRVGSGALYRYVLDGADARPDPAALSQPQGVHGPSEVVDHAAFLWDDGGWRGIALEAMVLYELHVGTFSAAVSGATS